MPFADDTQNDSNTTPTSDIEEDIDGYLEPVAMPTIHDAKKQVVLEDKDVGSAKLTDALKKAISRKSSCSSSDKGNRCKEKGLK